MEGILGDSGFGIMLFCSVQTEITDFPIIDLEFDCRGNIDDVVTIHDNLTGPPDARNHVLISAGEIKSSFESVAKAKSQLLKRLLVLKKGVELTCGPTFEILLEGIIFLPAEVRSKIEYENTHNGGTPDPHYQKYSPKYEYININ